MDRRQDQLNRPTAATGPPHPQPGQSSMNSEELKHDIRRTRSHLDETLDALTSKLRPGAMLMDVVSGMTGQTKADLSRSVAKSVGTVAGAKVLNGVKKHPLPAAVIGAGLAWWLLDNPKKRAAKQPDPQYGGSYVDARTGQPYDEETYGQGYRPPQDDEYDHGSGLLGSIANKISGAASSIGDALGLATEKVGHAASSTTHAIGSAASTTAGAVGTAASTTASGVGRAAGATASGIGTAAGATASGVGTAAGATASGVSNAASATGEGARTGVAAVGHGVTSAAEAARMKSAQGYVAGKYYFSEGLEKTPLAIGAAAIATGLLAGLLAPRTRTEDRLMGERSEEVKQRARDAAIEAKQRGQELAQDTAEAAKSAVADEGLTPGSITERVKHVAQAAAGAAKEQAEEEGLTADQLADSAKNVKDETVETAKDESKRHVNESEAPVSV